MEVEYNSFEADKKRFRMWTLGIISALILLAVLGWFGRSVYHHYKIKHDAAQAQAFLASGDYRNAWLSARQTLTLSPTNLPACRVMAALADLSHSPTVLDWQRRIVELEPTIDNKLALAATGLRYQNPPFLLTAQILAELGTNADHLASYQVIAASVALSLQHQAEAEAHFETATHIDPTNQLYGLNLAILRLGSTNTEKATAARAVLDKLRSDENLGAPALRALIVDRLSHRDTAAANDFSAQLLTHPKATVADQLQHLGILQELKSGAFAANVQAVQSLVATNAPGIAEVSAWMQANGLLAENIVWLTNLPATIQAQMPVRLALSDAYLQNSDWRALRDFVSKGKWDDMEFLRLALAARAWSQLDVKQVADSNWGAAVNEAGNRFGALNTLLGLIERWKWKHEQADLLQRIIQKFPRERWAQQSLERLYLADGNTAALNQLYLKMFAIYPLDLGLKNNLAATSLLLKTNLPQAYKWAAEVYAARTNDLFVTSTYAFALHLQGRTSEGLAILKTLNPSVLAQPDAALYYGVLLAASGATNEATPFLKIAEAKTEWLPEEKQLLSAAAGHL